MPTNFRPYVSTLEPSDLTPQIEEDSIEEERQGPEGVGNLIVRTAEVTVVHGPVFNTMVIPYVNGGLDTIVVDLPGLPPEISFYPFKNINNRIEILLNSNTGRVERTPIAISAADQSFFEDYYLLQTGVSKTYTQMIQNNLKIEFAKDDPPKIYEIYRLTEAPTAYTDFAGALLQRVEPEYGIPGALVDQIVPNTKYYYCARTLDKHNNISNPTFVYELQLVDNNGQIFLDQKVYIFPTPQPTAVQPGRRFVYVEPALTQVTLPDASVDSINDIGLNSLPPSSILGEDDVDPIWEKDFKLRVISKKTGRKLDLNIKFKNSGIVNQTE